MDEFKHKHRTSNNCFIRNRKMSFPQMIIFQLNMLKRSLQTEIVSFFSNLKSSHIMSKSAFSQSRMKFRAEAFLDLNAALVNDFYNDGEYRKWHGHRLCAIDGSTLNLPMSKDIIDYFNSIKNQTDIPLPLARISTYYDILNEIIIAPEIAPYQTSEYALAIRHTEQMQKNDLVLFDRGYAAFWLFLLLFSKKIDFVTRLPSTLFPDIWKSKKRSVIITISSCSADSYGRMKNLGIQFEPFRLRLEKVLLPTGETELLATSLFDKNKYPSSCFIKLYALRWGIEGKYNHLKNHIEIENFSGKSVLAIRQDFFANALIENIRALIAYDAQSDINEQMSNAQYVYKVNRNLSLGFLKDRLIDILLKGDKDYIEQVVHLFSVGPISVRPGRHFERKFHISLRRYRMNNRRSI